jgi:hypothetical protein
MRRLPLGFNDFDQLDRFGRELEVAIAHEGALAECYVIGTAATGWSMNIDQPPKAFSKDSDLDVVLCSDALLAKMMKAGGQPDTSWSFLGKYMWLSNDGPSGFLTVCQHLAAFVSKWSQLLGRKVDLRLLLTMPGDPSFEEFMRFQKPIELRPAQEAKGMSQ